MHEVVNLFEPDEFALEGGALFGGEIFLEPEVNVVDHGSEELVFRIVVG
jgi:hypothetical protein